MEHTRDCLQAGWRHGLTTLQGRQDTAQQQAVRYFSTWESRWGYRLLLRGRKHFGWYPQGVRGLLSTVIRNSGLADSGSRAGGQQKSGLADSGARAAWSTSKVYG
jgi:hypothetical protein